MKVDYELIGRRVREKRKEARISQEKLGELSDLSSVHISNIETSTKKPSLESLIRISAALGITLDELLTGNQINYPGDYQTDISMLMSDCNKNEKRFIYEQLQASKRIIRNNKWNLGHFDPNYPEADE